MTAGVLNHLPELQKKLREHADPDKKAWWEKYVKGSAPFLGTPMKSVRSALHGWHEAYIRDRMDGGDQLDSALELLRMEYTEEKLAGILWIQELLLPGGHVRCNKDIARFAGLFSQGHLYDWNACDWFCVKVLGPLIKHEGRHCAEHIAAWHKAPNLWQARASVVAFVGVASEKDYRELTKRSCSVLIKRDERFAKTAVGWILREISKHQKEFVKDFTREHEKYFSRESLRNALKYM